MIYPHEMSRWTVGPSGASDGWHYESVVPNDSGADDINPIHVIPKALFHKTILNDVGSAIGPTNKDTIRFSVIPQIADRINHPHATNSRIAPLKVYPVALERL